MPVHNGKSFIDNIIYTGPKIVEHTGQILCVEEEKTVTFDGTSFNTVMVPIVYPTPSPTPGVSYATEMRQEWMSENFNLPMSKDLTLANLTTNDLRGRFTRTRGANTVYYDPNNVYPNSKWKNYFLSSTPVSIEIGNGQRVYNSAAIDYIDNRYKSMGWRVPLWEDYKHLSLFWNLGADVENVALATAMGRFPKLHSGTMGITYGSVLKYVSGNDMANVGGNLERAYPMLEVVNGTYYGQEYRTDESPSVWRTGTSTDAEYFWYYASRAINYDYNSTPRGGWIDYDWGVRKSTSVWITRAINNNMYKQPEYPSASTNQTQDMRGAIISSDSNSNGRLVTKEGKYHIRIGIAYSGKVDPNISYSLYKAPWFYSVRLCKNVRVSPVIPPWL